ncbi:MAG: DHH family phosphoesterase [Candidatus Bathyarchaeota archaeon]|nr:MAG: DHH family phosphoesterase [Candidatus Bathyarchaeota archaeon]
MDQATDRRKLIEDVKVANDHLSDAIDNDEPIHVISHLDADGLAAAGILGGALWRRNANLHLRVQQWMDEKIVAEIQSLHPSLTVFTDMGAGYLDILSTRLPTYRIIVLDHHQKKGEVTENIVTVNPHEHGFDGSKEISGAGVTYLVAQALDSSNMDLAGLAVIGALGDQQDKFEKRSLGGLNLEIVKDAEKSGVLETCTDLQFFGRETRPIHKALAYTTTPFIPGISGEEDKSLSLLLHLNIKPKIGDRWRALRDLSSEEKRTLCSALSDHMVAKGVSEHVLNLIGRVYTLVNEEPWTPLRDAREFSVLLNSTGRMGRPSIGVAITLGDRRAAVDEASTILENYRHTITRNMNWLMEKPDRIREMRSIYLVQGEGFIDEKMIGTLASILSTTLPSWNKPIIAYAAVSEKGVVKVSARTLARMTEKGLNLGKIMGLAAKRFHGEGGGHDIAAGAQIPFSSVDDFVELVDELIYRDVSEVFAEG